LDGGTTTLQVARHLPLNLQATIVTNSPPIAIALAEHPQIEVVGLATAAKLDTAATYVVGPIQALTYLVTASTVATETLTEYKDLGLTVIRDEDF
jgi:DeoR/GlpR family transcriptional regulator of sugar metabolism